MPTDTILKGKSYQYLIEKVLGQGSFGITYLASVKMAGALGSIDANIKVAIKEFFMRDINGRSDTTVTSGSKGGIYDEYKRKFNREALNLSKLQHPNIIKVIESFEANNTMYYVMEYISGGSLDNYIAKNNGLKEGEAIKIVKQIGSALSFMHSQGMLHLDLKPSNIMLKDTGDIVVIDFGLSKQYDESGEPESSTKVGAGTPGYAPIEQANYKEGKGFPVTMDVYALGGTLFKMLTGKRPPEASEILNDGFPLYELQEHNVLDAHSACIAKAMAPTKKDRYQSVIDFLKALDNEEEATIVDIEIAEKNKSNTKSDTYLNTDDNILNIHKKTRKVRIEYFPSIFSGKEEYIREISYDSVRYMHGHNLYSPFQKRGEKWLEYSISRENYEKFLIDLEQLNLNINPDGSKREEWGTDSTRLKIILYDEQNKEYNTVWKNSWSDDYGGGENGKLEGSPIEIYERIINILPQKDKEGKSKDSAKIVEKKDEERKDESYSKDRQEERDLRQLVEHMKECEEYKEAYKTCLQYIKEGRCKSVAQELSQELVPLMKKQNQHQNRKQIVIVTIVTIIVMILSILLNSLR
ncbi:MAG: serine/threonine protein kinase [Prevotella sp.]|nr:serine/threonine protein kinase [Prevotella sp.]